MFRPAVPHALVVAQAAAGAAHALDEAGIHRPGLAHLLGQVLNFFTALCRFRLGCGCAGVWVLDVLSGA